MPKPAVCTFLSAGGAGGGATCLGFLLVTIIYLLGNKKAPCGAWLILQESSGAWQVPFWPVLF